MSEEPLLTVGEVADRLRVARQTVYEHIWSGDLPHLRLGTSGRIIRVSETDLSEFKQNVRHGRMEARS